MLNVTNTTTDLNALAEHGISKKIWVYVSPIVLICGTITNILSIAVLLRKCLRHSSSMFYLTVLSIADIFVLYTGLLRLWISETWEFDFRTISDTACKISVFLVYFALDFASWILIAVTVDRCMIVCLPFKGRSYATLERAKLTTFIIVLVAIAVNCHILWTAALVDENTCLSEYGFVLYVWPWIDLFKHSFIPFVVMLTTNSLIVRQLIRSNRRINAQTRNNVLRTISGDENSTTSNASTKRHTMHIPSITAMLLVISIAFFLLTSPLVIYYIADIWIREDTVEVRQRWDLFRTIANMLQYTNNAIHFFLYCLAGPRFRKEFWTSLKWKKNFRVRSVAPM